MLRTPAPLKGALGFIHGVIVIVRFGNKQLKLLPIKQVLEYLTSISVILSSILIPLLVLHFGNEFNETQQAAERHVKLIELAISVIQEEPRPETLKLRQWAIALLKQEAESILPMPPEASDEIRDHRAFQYFDNYVGGTFSNYSDANSTDKRSHPNSTKQDVRRPVPD